MKLSRQARKQILAELNEIRDVLNKQASSGFFKPEPIEYEDEADLDASIDSVLLDIVDGFGFLNATKMVVKGDKAYVKVEGEIELDVKGLDKETVGEELSDELRSLGIYPTQGVSFNRLVSSEDFSLEISTIPLAQKGTSSDYPAALIEITCKGGSSVAEVEVYDADEKYNVEIIETHRHKLKKVSLFDLKGLARWVKGMILDLDHLV